MSIKPLEIVELESKAGNIYEAIVIAGKRARQINDEQKVEFNQRIQPLLEKEEEDDENVVSKDKMELSIVFETKVKPTEEAVEELLNDQLDFRIRSEE